MFITLKDLWDKSFEIEQPTFTASPLSPVTLVYCFLSDYHHLMIFPLLLYKVTRRLIVFAFTNQVSPVQCETVNKRSPITSLLTAGSDQTINEPEENLSAYFEPFGSALVPNSPGNRDSIASCESDSLLVAEKKDEEVNLWFSLLCR